MPKIQQFLDKNKQREKSQTGKGEGLDDRRYRSWDPDILDKLRIETPQETSGESEKPSVESPENTPEKPGKNWVQTRDKLGTKWVQTGYRNGMIPIRKKMRMRFRSKIYQWCSGTSFWPFLIPVSIAEVWTRGQ
jgi:hypothetical protein